MTRPAAVYLASMSPRRRQLLQQIGVCHERVPVDVDETPLPGEVPAEYAQRLALAKGQAGQAALRSRAPLPVIGADTVVVVDGTLMGKPRNRRHALEMLEALSGTTHEVMTAVAVVAAHSRVRLSTSRVTFRALTLPEREAYWDSGEPADKAGGYAVQGLGAAFIARLEGSYSGVMGLPLYETACLLEEFGVGVLCKPEDREANDAAN